MDKSEPKPSTSAQNDDLIEEVSSSEENDDSEIFLCNFCRHPDVSRKNMVEHLVGEHIDKITKPKEKQFNANEKETNPPITKNSNTSYCTKCCTIFTRVDNECKKLCSSCRQIKKYLCRYCDYMTKSLLSLGYHVLKKHSTRTTRSSFSDKECTAAQPKFLKETENNDERKKVGNKKKRKLPTTLLADLSALKIGYEKSDDETPAKKPLLSNPEPQSTGDRSGWFNCEQCNYRALRKFTLVSHVKMWHSHKMDENGLLVCQYCSRKFDKPLKITRHEKICKKKFETPKYECALCSFKTTTKEEIVEHMFDQHQAYAVIRSSGPVFNTKPDSKNEKNEAKTGAAPKIKPKKQIKKKFKSINNQTMSNEDTKSNQSSQDIPSRPNRSTRRKRTIPDYSKLFKID